ncbi:MAG: arylesterase [Pseudomonadota bacterium]
MLRYGALRASRNACVVAGVAIVALGTQVSAGQITIAALGDSLTQGFGLPPEDGFVPQLEAWLRSNGVADVTVLNAGVSGDTTAGGLARVAWTLTDDVDAMIVALGGNDLLRGIEPATSRANIDGILQAAALAEVPVLLSGMRAPANYGPDFKEDFDTMYPDLAAAYDALLHPFFLEGLGAGEDLGAARALLQPDGIHPNQEGVARIVAQIGPFVQELIERAEN